MAPTASKDVVRRLRYPAYSFLTVTLLFQIFDYVGGQLSPQPSSVVWRFAAIGTLSNNAGNVLLIILLIYALALFAADRAALLFVGVTSALIAVVLLSGTVIFGLDMLELRGKVAADALEKFDLASGQALVKLSVEGCIAALFAASAFRANAAARHDTARADTSIAARPSVFRAP